MNKIYTILLGSLFCQLVIAQDNTEIKKGATALEIQSATLENPDGWKKGGNITLNFSQVALNNWAGGGQNSLAISGLANFYANFKKGKNALDNTLALGYGLMQQGDAGMFKTDDKIDFASKYGRKAFGKWYYSGLVNFKTQFDVGYRSPTDLTVISRFLAPGYLIGAIGMDYKPNDNFSVFISPVTNKTTLVFDNSLNSIGAFGVGIGQRVRYEVGGYVKAAFKKEIFTNVNLAATVDLFSNYLHNPQNIDVNGQLLLSMKVNKYLTTSIAMNMIYDNDVNIQVSPTVSGPRLQFKEVLSIGLGVKF